MLFFILMWFWFGSKPEAIKVKTPEAAAQVRRIVIDAGHGGKDAGAVYPSGLREKDVVLDVAKQVRDGMIMEGFHVIMTRDSDVFIPLENRAKIANKKEADLFVSIHANASTSPSLRGFEVYYLSETADDRTLAAARAKSAPLEILGAPASFVDENLKTIFWLLKQAKNRTESALLSRWITDRVAHSVPVEGQRIRPAGFYVLKWTQCPAVLVEIGYGTNIQDENRLKSVYYRRRLAAAITQGIKEFVQQNEKNGRTAPPGKLPWIK